MPEGHSIHRLARRHATLLAGRTVSASSPQGRFAGGAARLDGRRLVETDAWGKHLFHRYASRDTVDGDPLLDAEPWLHVHLGLFGRWRDGHGDPPDPRGALRLRLVAGGPGPAWTDLRGPTACELMADAERDLLLARLGPDPLRPDADPASALARITRSRRAVGALLMDQSVVAGIGNVYRAEVLYRHGVDPHRPGRDLDVVEWAAMWDDLVVLMGAGVRAGRIVTTEPDDRARLHGRPRRADAHYVYGRAGLPCRRCGTPVHREEMAARTVYWCAVCQA
ncbi:Fpg/Nei family DNA glycosylase [Nocardioides dongxiaopingii]|uniref:Fpg/Nei family DNA glycosylase n=1 Tax=Nocardioides dongxiaopingii TaxID=2576036 RepID=UPI0010C76963|nr:DNA-formamidopyrimidine glycosylase family protein [Nocardioides dongxiaopingii]